MNIIQRFANVFRKESQGRVALAFNQVGQPVYTPSKFKGFTKEGYEKNVMVYACIRKIALACAGIEWELYSKRIGGKPVEIENHPILTLLEKPNPLQGRAQFFESLISFYMLTGNSYVEANRPSGIPLELWTLRPDLMSVVPNALGYVGKYIFDTGSVKKEFPVDVVSMQGNIYHLKTFSPTDIWYGQSPLCAAMISLDQNNAINRSNLALVQNNSTPSGVLSVKESKSNSTGNLSDTQFSRLQEQIDEQFQPSKNNKPIVLEGGLEYKAIAWSPKEMDFLNNKNVTSMDICLAFGVPPEIMGLGKTTYNNYAEALASFYKDTILPIMDTVKTDLNNWLVPMYDKNKLIKLEYNKDDIEALQYQRDEKMKSLENISYLQLNEKRQAAGYEPKPGWDVFLIGGQIYSEPEITTDGNDDEEDDSEQENLSQRQNAELEAENASETDAEPKAWKVFNLFNKQEQQATLKRINRKRARLESDFQRDLASDFKEMQNDMAKALKSSSEPSVIRFALQKAVDENEAVIKKTLNRHIKYSVDDFGRNTLNQAKSQLNIREHKSERQWEDWAEQYVSRRTNDAIKQIQGTTKNQVRRIMERVESALIDGNTVDSIASEISSEFGNISKSRSTLIARTEVGSASTQSTLEAAKSLQVPNMVKTWIASNDERTRDGDKGGPDHLTMDGVEVPIDEKFTVPPDTDMEGPGDMTAGADQVCNCRCALTFTSRA